MTFIQPRHTLHATLATCVVTIGVLSNLTTASAEDPTLSSTTKLSYPDTRKDDVVDDYHGRTVADPYRWLEDVESDETEAWVKAQNEVTQGYLQALPQREPMRKRLEELWDYSRTGLPAKRGDTYFYTFNDGLQNQSVLYRTPVDVSPSQWASEREVLLDPNKLSEDGTMSMASWSPSDDGKYLAYAIADGGSDWRTWRVREVATGQDTDDLIEWSKFSGVAWTPDNQGFYYSRYAAPVEGQELTGTNDNQMLYLHRLGTPQSEDQLIMKRPDHPKWGFGASVTDDGRYLVIGNWKGTEPKTQVFIQDLSIKNAPVRGLIMGFDADYTFIGNEGSTLFFLTDHEAPRRRVISLDVAEHAARTDDNIDEPADRSGWKEIIPQSDNVLEDVSLLGGTFFANYLVDALNQVERFGLDGEKLGSLKLPGKGSVGGLGGKQDATETFFSFTNYVTPPSIHKVDVATGESELAITPEVAFNVSDYITEQVFCTSKDGTKVPILITRHKGSPLDGSNRTLLYAYGGFNISLTPSYSPAIAAWLDAGGVYAVANLRGGGEYGRQWHEDGMQLKKQNVFDDFIAAAEHLIDMGVTRKERLGVRGGSNGGLLIGAVMTQRPDLFGACLPAVGVMDMLRYHKFTIGWAWVTEYGSSDDETQIDNLLSYSPLHNLKPGTCYPATMVSTADRDDRVVPGHSFKFAAALQAAQSCDNPTLIRIETRAGHGAGTPTSKKIEEYADLWSFLLQNLK
ncbi:prolyl oligopeptidase family serine peptidase [Rhodopirellula halodulae]|uniref:prolyl oligopeptidase family serine peptidase n=1 Tax=Rhodopirellula halodulae TaxID=2894198 RepID=UPI001E60620F|nr:prolyl oligopeptidase family serine peptidase [Rhodopirellula sp. JC737]MCC9655879.1 prolyl oligopeptidase family serine peptidase [Rhodopirellula sp. JC737]